MNVPWFQWEDLERPAPCGPYEIPSEGIFFIEYQGFCYRQDGATDFLIREYSARGVRPVAILIGVPEWARGQRECSEPVADDVYCIPDDPTKFGRFAAYVAWRYDGTHGQGRVDDFVIHNEVNTNDWFNTACDRAGTPACESSLGIRERLDQYGINFSLAYDAIVARNPSAKVFFSFTHQFDRSFDSDGALTGSAFDKGSISVKTMVEGLADRVSPRKWRVAYHPYWRDGNTPATPDDLPWVTFGNIGALVGWLQQQFPDKPWAHEVYLTESGFPTFATPGQFGHDPSLWAFRQLLQADELCRSYETVLGTPGITNYVYHRFQDGFGEGAAPGMALDPGSNFGLVGPLDPATMMPLYKLSWGTFALANRIDLAPPRLSCGFENLPFTVLK